MFRMASDELSFADLREFAGYLMLLRRLRADQSSLAKNFLIDETPPIDRQTKTTDRGHIAEFHHRLHLNHSLKKDKNEQIICN